MSASIARKRTSSLILGLINGLLSLGFPNNADRQEVERYCKYSRKTSTHTHIPGSNISHELGLCMRSRGRWSLLKTGRASNDCSGDAGLMAKDSKAMHRGSLFVISQCSFSEDRLGMYRRPRLDLSDPSTTQQMQHTKRPFPYVVVTLLD